MSAPSSSRRYLLAGLATAGLVGGGAVVANAATADSAAAPSTTSSTSAPSRPTPPTPRPHLDGTVVAVSGSTIMLKDHDGFTRVIQVGSGTKYTLDGKTSTLSAVTRGRFVHGDGTVDSVGTSLDATAVAILTSTPKPGAGPDSHPGGRGPGGRGPGGRGPGGRGPGGPAGRPVPGKAPASGKAPAGGTAPASGKAPSGAPSAPTPSPSTTAHGS